MDKRRTLSAVLQVPGISDVTSPPAFALLVNESEPYDPDGTSRMTDQMTTEAWATAPLSQADLSFDTRKEQSEVEARKLE